MLLQKKIKFYNILLLEEKIVVFNKYLTKKTHFQKCVIV